MTEKYSFASAEKGILEASPIPFAIYQFINRRVVTILVSDGFCKMKGMDREETIYVMDHDMYRDTHHDDESRVANEAVRFATKGGDYEVTYRSKRPGTDDFFIIHAIGSHVYTEDGTRLAVVWYTDEGNYREKESLSQAIQEAGEMETDVDTILKTGLRSYLHINSLKKDNLYDALTGLPNMSYFPMLAESFREEVLAGGEEPLMLFFDLSGMKNYNEKYGFEKGDLMLRGMSNVLRRYFSNENLGRFGSDHFVAVTIDDGSLESVLEKIFQDIASLNDGRSLPVRVGIYRNSFETVSAFIAADRAKAACDVKKATYLSSYTYFDQGLYEKLSNKAYVLDNFERALSEGWIQAYYQPIVRSVSGLVCDEEALARWIDPERGMLPPDEFIPILEEAHLLHRLDLRMVDLIVEGMRKKKQFGMRVVPVSVNLSWYDFQHCDMVDEITRKIDAVGMPHDLLNIEITESVIGRDPSYMKIQIDRFREKGFPVWMDDFGSGYSSLDLLQHFDFDLIKFNMQFMQEFGKSPKNKIIMNMLTQMAVKMGVDTLTEGVERFEQLAFLREIGCDKIQGFYYSKPNPLDEVIRRYTTGEGIGMENYREYEYLDAISKTNLNDPAVTEEIDPSFYTYFSAIPMAVLELAGGSVRVLRWNKTFGDFLVDHMYSEAPSDDRAEAYWIIHPEEAFVSRIRDCQKKDSWQTVTLGKDGHTCYLKQLKENPVNGAVSFVIIIQTMFNRKRETGR